jgi:hypothetical protein
MIRHPLFHKKNGSPGLMLGSTEHPGSFTRTPRHIIRHVYRQMRRDGVEAYIARHYILRIVMAADWPE